MIKVIIAGDQPITTNGLNNILSGTSHIMVTGIYASIHALLKTGSEVDAHVLILDKQLQKNEGVATIRTILENMPGIQILLFSSNNSLYHVGNMLEAGCKGYLLKDADGNMLIKAVETVFQGSRFLSPLLENAFLGDMLLNRSTARKPELTRREKEVLQLIVEEHTNPEIAAKLFLSPFTIESHRTNILHKLGAKNTAGIVKMAFVSGLV